MNQTPVPPPVVIPEVLPPESSRSPGTDETPPTRRVAFHALSALVLILVDNLWSLPEFLVIDWPITVPLCFLTVFIATFLIQRRKNQDSRGNAFCKALLLAVLAGIPTADTGTPVGLALLAWAGIRHPWKAS